MIRHLLRMGPVVGQGGALGARRGRGSSREGPQASAAPAPGRAPEHITGSEKFRHRAGTMTTSILLFASFEVAKIKT